jgi:superfamily II DNA or RNA helicase
MKIKKIKKIDYNEDVYNLRIKDNHNYFANNYCVSNCHTAKSKSIQTILGKTFDTAKFRFGMSGTYPVHGTSELFAIESVTGPLIQKIKAKTLMDKGLISNVKIKSLILNYNDKNFSDNIFIIKKNGGGGKAWQLEKEYAQQSLKRKQFISKLIQKFKHNSLVLFINVDFGKNMYDYFRDNIVGVDFYHIDGSTELKKREYIKKQMEITPKYIEYTILNFGDYEIEIKSDSEILLKNGEYKKSKDITIDDDINDDFIKKLIK